ncbi:MAG: exodeoxyribonuclease VII small subunit [Rhodobacteraceae bacterium]|nr:exodeoxyribonuclease VII small subunit [Paracoccaceae bacterium]
MTDQQLPEDIATMTFEEAMKEFEAVVKRLEDGEIPLNDSIELYVRGDLLKRRCEASLAEAQARIDAVSQKPVPQLTPDG